MLLFCFLDVLFSKFPFFGIYFSSPTSSFTYSQTNTCSKTQNTCQQHFTKNNFFTKTEISTKILFNLQPKKVHNIIGMSQ